MCHFGLAAISRTSCREATGGEAGNVCVCVCACVEEGERESGCMCVCVRDRKEATDKNVTE